MRRSQTMQRLQKRCGIVALLSNLMLALLANGADWPQWQGPGRDNVSKETGLLKSWPKDGPQLLWTCADVGMGYSGPAIVGDRLYILGARGDTEYVLAFDLQTAKDKTIKELWAAQIGPKFTWKGNTWNAGPSCTPSVDTDMLYALGGQGELVCLETATGKERWRKSMSKDLNGEVNDIGGGLEKFGWGYTWSPLVDGDQVVCVPGGSDGTLAALDKKTGNVRWRSKELTDQATYSSPLAAEIGGVRQYIEMTNAGVAGVSANDGKLLWYYVREKPYGDIVAPTPIVRDNYVFATAAPDGGGDLVQLTPDGSKFKAEKVYAGKDYLANHHGGVVLIGDYLYGCSGDQRAKWMCQDFKSGKIVWEKEDRRVGKGSLTYADGRLYCMGEKSGLVLLVEATPEGWKEHGRFAMPKESKQRLARGGIWTHPVVANGRLYLRDQELLFCYQVK